MGKIKSQRGSVVIDPIFKVTIGHHETAKIQPKFRPEQSFSSFHGYSTINRHLIYHLVTLAPFSRSLLDFNSTYVDHTLAMAHAGGCGGHHSVFSSPEVKAQSELAIVIGLCPLFAHP